MTARVGDPVICMSPCVGGCNVCPHPWTGTITGGSSNLFINGIPAARMGDKGSIICPHGGSFTITGSSGDVANGPKFARMTDEVTCTKCGAKGKIMSGSPNVMADNL